MSDRIADLAMMAREAEDPEDRAWAQAEYAKAAGKPLAPEHTSRGPWREGFFAGVPLNPLEASLQRKDARLMAQPAPRGQGSAADVALRQLGEREEPTMQMDTPTSKGDARFMGALQGASMGQARTMADDMFMFDPEVRIGRTAHREEMKPYGKVLRESYRKAEADRPAQFLQGEIPGALANPGLGSGGGFAVQAGRAGVEGALYAAGTEKDPLTGAALGAGGSLLGNALLSPIQAAYRKLAGSAPQRIINEAAEGGGNASATATARKHLAKSEEGIAREVISGPQGNQVRQALSGPAKSGMKSLDAVVDPLTDANEAAYAAFDKAGRGQVDVKLVLGGLEKQAKEAIASGKSQTAKGIRAYAERVAADAAETEGKLTLQQLRGLTTEAQEIAKGAIGGLNEHPSSKRLARVAAAASKVNDAVLGVAAEGDEALQAAAQSIRANNKRISPLLTGKKALEARDYKERTGGSLRSKAKSIAGSAATGAVIGGFAGEDENRVDSALTGAAGGIALSRGLPFVAGKVDSALTSAAIRAARNPNPLVLSQPFQDAARRGALPGGLNLLDVLMSRQQENR